MIPAVRSVFARQSTPERQSLPGQRIDGPFTETKELIAGYTIIKVKSKEEALEWSRRFPNPHGESAEGEIEVRRLFELDDFGQSESVDRFRKLEGARSSDFGF